MTDSAAAKTKSGDNRIIRTRIRWIDWKVAARYHSRVEAASAALAFGDGSEWKRSHTAQRGPHREWHRDGARHSQSPYLLNTTHCRNGCARLCYITGEGPVGGAETFGRLVRRCPPWARTIDATRRACDKRHVTCHPLAAHPRTSRHDMMLDIQRSRSLAGHGVLQGRPIHAKNIKI